MLSFGTRVLDNLTGTQITWTPWGHLGVRVKTDESLSVPLLTKIKTNGKEQLKNNRLNRYTQIDKKRHRKCGLSSQVGATLECYTFCASGCADRRPDFMRLRAYTRRKSARKTTATPNPPTMVTA